MVRPKHIFISWPLYATTCSQWPTACFSFVLCSYSPSMQVTFLYPNNPRPSPHHDFQLSVTKCLVTGETIITAERERDEAHKRKRWMVLEPAAFCIRSLDAVAVGFISGPHRCTHAHTRTYTHLGWELLTFKTTRNMAWSRTGWNNTWQSTAVQEKSRPPCTMRYSKHVFFHSNISPLTTFPFYLLCLH